MNGVLNVLKPPGMTCADLLNQMKRILKAAKIGHTGTLDPGAAGVLPVCLGKATRLADLIMGANKIYRCEMVLGVETDTLDAYGSIQTTSTHLPDLDTINKILPEFIGNIEQIPPIHSAIKHKGNKMYELARMGKDVEPPTRKVTIYRLDLVYYSSPDRIMFEVECSKGTYIRSLCRDIGRRLKCGAFMAFLLRCSSGEYKLEDAYTLDEIKEYASSGLLQKILIPMDRAVERLDLTIISPQAYARVLNGNKIGQDEILSGKDDLKDKSLVRVYCQDEFIGLGRVSFENDSINMEKVLI